MYFKGIIKNNETNFLACRIIGFVALIFLFFSRRIRAPATAAGTAQRAPAHYADVIAKSSFPLSGFFIIFIHSPRGPPACPVFRSPSRVPSPFGFPTGPPFTGPRRTRPRRTPTTRERYFFLCSTPGISLPGIIATNKIVKFRQIYAVHYFLLLCPSRL